MMSNRTNEVIRLDSKQKFAVDVYFEKYWIDHLRVHIDSLLEIWNFSWPRFNLLLSYYFKN